MISRSPALHDATARSSTVRSGASYAVQRALTEAAFLAVAVVILIWTLLPIYQGDAGTTPVSDAFAGRFWPDHPTLENFRIVLGQDHFFLQNFWRQLGNSIFVAVATMVMVLVVAMASYAIGRLKVRYGHVISNAALLTYLIPAAFLAVPFYVVMAQYGLLNTLWALIFAMSTFAIPYAIWVLRQYGDTIPFVDEAKVDGATPASSTWSTSRCCDPRRSRSAPTRSCSPGTSICTPSFCYRRRRSTPFRSRWAISWSPTTRLEPA